MTAKKPKKQPSKYLLLSGAGLQMGITIYLAVYLGKWLDIKFPNENNIYKTILTIFGVVLSFYSLLKQVNKINK